MQGVELHPTRIPVAQAQAHGGALPHVAHIEAAGHEQRVIGTTVMIFNPLDFKRVGNLLDDAHSTQRIGSPHGVKIDVDNAIFQALAVGTFHN